MTQTPKRVAIVDDDESVRRALGRLLRSAGMLPECFDSAEAFLDSLATRRPDCLLVDVRMPGMDGSELLQRLSELGHCIPAVVITAHEDDTTSRPERFPGAIAFLLKPLDDQILLNAIRNAQASPP